jgi:hypothetical protein
LRYLRLIACYLGQLHRKHLRQPEAAKTSPWLANDTDIDLLHRGNGLHSPVPSAAEKESAVSLGRENRAPIKADQRILVAPGRAEHFRRTCH